MFGGRFSVRVTHSNLKIDLLFQKKAKGVPGETVMLYHFHLKFDTFQTKLDTLLNKLIASKIKLNILQIKMSFFDITIENFLDG